jgi:predicted ribonuclease YlaK
LKTAVKRLDRWSQLGSEEPPAIPIGLPRDNVEEVRHLFSEIEGLLDGYRRASPLPRLMRVIDTSALMDCAKPREYGEGAFEFIIPRTVLAELDDLQHRQDRGKRNRAQVALKGIREWKRRGSLLDGVIEDRTIKIRVLGKEPSMAKAPPDLQSSEDDRIIWTARELTFHHPWSTVILVSGDFNLCARAELEHVQTESSPK